MDNMYDVGKDLNLIYDVGLHKGEDALFYLRKGFKVVGFEANPDLVADCKIRLKSFIENGQMTIVEGAIIDIPENTDALPKTVQFFKNEEESVWGTVDAEWAKRNERMGTSSEVIIVGVVDFAEVLKQYGVPYYMKVDIEGCDYVCLNELKKFVHKPSYISIESAKTSLSDIKKETQLLVDLGYNAFNAVEQGAIPKNHKPPVPAREGDFTEFKFEMGSSGLFGKELNGEWKNFGEIIRQYRMIQLGYKLVGDDGLLTRWSFPGAWRIKNLVGGILKIVIGADVPGWYDTHARHSSAID